MNKARRNALLTVFLILFSGICFSDDTKNVELVSKLTSAELKRICLQGNYVFALSNQSFSIYDVSVTSMPTRVSYYEGLTFAEALFVSGNYAYIVDDPGLRILDITNPYLPDEVAFYSNYSSVCDIFVKDHYAYFVDHSSLTILDISNPYVPVKTGSVYIPGSNSIDISGQYAYIAAGDVLKVIDISNPASPIEISHVNFPSGNENNARKVQVQGSYAYVAAELSGLRIVNISNPLNPTETGYCSSLITSNLFINDNFAYIPGNALRIIDITNKASPVLISTVSISWCDDVQISDNYAFVVNYSQGLKILDVSDPLNIHQVGSYCPPVNPSKINIIGNDVYVKSDDYFYHLDVSNPISITPIECSTSDYYTNGIFRISDQNYAFENTAFNITSIVDIAELENPVRIKSYNLGNAKDIFLVGNYAYLIFNYTLKLLNLVSPTSPVEIASYNYGTGLTHQKIASTGNYVFGLREPTYHPFEVIDFTNPDYPVKRGSCYIKGNDVTDMTASSNYVYILTSDYWPYPNNDLQGLRIVDVSNPNFPFITSSTHITDDPMEIILSGNYAFIAACGAGLRILDISDPYCPYEVGYYDADEYDAQGLALSQGYIYLANGRYGLLTLKFNPPQKYSISGYVKDYEGNGIDNVTVRLSGTKSGLTSTAKGGFYQFLNLTEGFDYNILPEASTYTFKPVSISSSSFNKNFENIDFIGLKPFFINGFIKAPGGIPISGVKVSLTGDDSKTSFTDGCGYYEFTKISSGSYTITPYNFGQKFAPAKRDCIVIDQNKLLPDFIVVLNSFNDGAILIENEVVVEVGAEGGITKVTDGSSLINGAEIEMLQGTVLDNAVVSIGKVSNITSLPLGARCQGCILDFEIYPENIHLEKLPLIKIPYNNIPNPCDLRVYAYNKVESLWEEATVKEVDRRNKLLVLEANHFTYYALAFIVKENLDGIKIYPNPCKLNADNNQIIFSNTTLNTKIKIYSLCGELIKTLHAVDGQAVWNLRNEMGQNISSGIYIYIVTEEEEKKIGKIALIR